MRPEVFLADPANLPNCMIVALNGRSSEGPSRGNFGFLANRSRPCVVDKPSFINSMQSVGISTCNYFQTQITFINVDFLLSFLSPVVFHEGACQLVVRAVEPQGVFLKALLSHWCDFASLLLDSLLKKSKVCFRHSKLTFFFSFEDI